MYFLLFFGGSFFEESLENWETDVNGRRDFREAQFKLLVIVGGAMEAVLFFFKDISIF